MKVQDILDALSTSEIVQELAVLVLVKEPGKPGIARQSVFERRICHVYHRGFRKRLQKLFLPYPKGWKDGSKMGQRPTLAGNENIPPPLSPEQ